MKKPNAISLIIDEDVISIPVRTSRRSSRLTLRIDPALGGAAMVIPDGVGQAEAEDFARRNVGWIRTRLARMPVPVPFEPDQEIPFLGEMHRIEASDLRGRGVVWEDTGADGQPVLYVKGEDDHLARRLTDWLKKQAREELTWRVDAHAAKLGVSRGRISIRDTRSRWGSCTSKGDLNFSWRLILTPPDVIDYVAAHEVAHIREMNHSPRFWKLVDQLVDDAKTTRAWLKRNGAGLHRYG